MTENDDRWSVSLSGATLLGRYEVERKMGGGGMATVYLARDEQLGLDVVVKVPHAAFLSDPSFRTRFQQETEGLIALQHPHIVKIHARGEHEGLPFLVMQYLAGGSLGDRMRRSAVEPVEIDDVLRWLPGIADALDFIHGQGIVHRDIKPDNVLFDEHGYVYLSDFGIAKAVGADDTGLTATGATPGSPAYMAPEQARTNELDGASDQYSLAASLYEVLAGVPAYEGETVMAVLLKKQSEDPTPILTHVPDLPAPVASAIMRALSREPADRFPSCAAFAAAMSAPPPREPPPQAPAERAPPPPAPPAPARAPAPVARAASDAGSRGPPAVGTFTFSSSRNTMFALVMLVLVGVPLVWVLNSSGDGDGDGDRGAEPPTDVASAPPSRLPADVSLASDRPEASAPKPGVERGGEDGVAGTYALDAPALRARIASMRSVRAPMGHKRTRPLAHVRELSRILESGFHVQIGADQRFVLTLAPDTNRAKTIHGSWKEADDVLVFTPDETDEREGRVFSARRVPGGLSLLMAQEEIFLARN